MMSFRSVLAAGGAELPVEPDTELPVKADSQHTHVITLREITSRCSVSPGRVLPDRLTAG